MYRISAIVKFPYFSHKFLEVRYIAFSGICCLLFRRVSEFDIFVFFFPPKNCTTNEQFVFLLVYLAR